MGSLQFKKNSTKTTLEALVSAINLWNKGHQAVFNFDCRGGLAWLNFSAFLGRADIRTENDSEEIKVKISDDKKKQPSPSKKKRSAIRAAKFRENRTRREDEYPKAERDEENKEEQKENDSSSNTKTNEKQNSDNIAGKLYQSAPDNLAEEFLLRKENLLEKPNPDDVAGKLFEGYCRSHKSSAEMTKEEIETVWRNKLIVFEKEVRNWAEKLIAVVDAEKKLRHKAEEESEELKLKILRNENKIRKLSDAVEGEIKSHAEQLIGAANAEKELRQAAEEKIHELQGLIRLRVWKELREHQEEKIHDLQETIERTVWKQTKAYEAEAKAEKELRQVAEEKIQELQDTIAQKERIIKTFLDGPYDYNSSDEENADNGDKSEDTDNVENSARDDDEENVDNENDFEATENIAEPAGDYDWTEDYDEIKYLEHLCNIEAEKAQMMQEATQNFHSRRNLAQKYLESLSLQNNEVLKELTGKAKKSMDSQRTENHETLKGFYTSIYKIKENKKKENRRKWRRKWRKTKEVEVPSPKKLSDIEEEIEPEEASSKVNRNKGGLFPGLKVQKSTYQKAIEKNLAEKSIQRERFLGKYFFNFRK